MANKKNSNYQTGQKASGPSDETLEDHQTGLEAEEALQDMGRQMEKISEQEYRKMASDLRWEVLDFCDQNPQMSVTSIAERFGIKEGTIRAWKAHLTMGTYQRQMETFRERTRKSQTSMFESEPEPDQSFSERKRQSNFIHFFDKTPPGVVCPHFHILAHANGCPYECQYCYLNLTLRHHPKPTVFSNTARQFQEVREWLMAEDGNAVLNTGELSDSLAWDDRTHLSRNLVPLFAEQKRHKLLFLTKSTNIANLRGIEPTPQVIVSFSLNAPEVSKRFEKKSPGPMERLAAALELKQLGWCVRVRIDPVIPIDNWKEHYQPLIDTINELAPDVVTLGSLRYFKTLVNHARYGKDVFSYGVDNHDPDGRRRLPEQLRLEIYSHILSQLETLRKGLCKETSEIHQQLDLPGRHQSCNCTYE